MNLENVLNSYLPNIAPGAQVGYLDGIQLTRDADGHIHIVFFDVGPEDQRHEFKVAANSLQEVEAENVGVDDRGTGERSGLKEMTLPERTVTVVESVWEENQNMIGDLQEELDQALKATKPLVESFDVEPLELLNGRISQIDNGIVGLRQELLLHGSAPEEPEGGTKDDIALVSENLGKKGLESASGD